MMAQAGHALLSSKIRPDRRSELLKVLGGYLRSLDEALIEDLGRLGQVVSSLYEHMKGKPCCC